MLVAALVLLLLALAARVAYVLLVPCLPWRRPPAQQLRTLVVLGSGARARPRATT